VTRAIPEALADRLRTQELVFPRDEAARPVAMKDVLAQNDPEAIRYVLLGAARGGPVAVEVKREGDRVSFPAIDEAERRVEHMYMTRAALEAAAQGAEAALGNVLQGQASVIDGAPPRVGAALAHDLDTPRAVAAIVELVKAANEVVLEIPRLKRNKPAQDSARQLAARAVQALDGACALVGLMQAPADEFAARTRARRTKARGLDPRAIDAKVRDRMEARAAKDFARADALRKALDALGVDVLDAGDQSTWRVKI
jgi:cysteinyl-tRNA synthetase